MIFVFNNCRRVMWEGRSFKTMVRLEWQHTLGLITRHPKEGRKKLDLKMMKPWQTSFKWNTQSAKGEKKEQQRKRTQVWGRRAPKKKWCPHHAICARDDGLRSSGATNHQLVLVLSAEFWVCLGVGVLPWLLVVFSLWNGFLHLCPQK